MKQEGCNVCSSFRAVGVHQVCVNSCHYSFIYPFMKINCVLSAFNSIVFNPLVWEVNFSQCTVWYWENQMSPKVMGKNMQSNWHPFKSPVFCRVHRARSSGTRGL